MKKLTALLLCFSLLLSLPLTGGAWATKNIVSKSSRPGTEVFTEDFTDDAVGESPSGFESVNYGGKVYVDTADTGDGKTKNVLVLSDTTNPSSSDWSGPSTVRAFSAQQGIVSVEVRFKVTKTNSEVAPLTVNLRNSGDSICSVSVDTSNGVLSYTYGPSLAAELAGPGKWPQDEWVTVRVTIDFKEQTAAAEVWADCLINSDINFAPSAKYEPSAGKLTYTGLSLTSSFTGNSINEIRFAMSRYEGISSIDYVSVYKDAKMPVGNTNITAIAPALELPAAVPSGKYVNIFYNGEYHYLPAKTLRINYSNYCTVDDLCGIFGYSYEKNGTEITVNADKTVKIPEDKIVKRNGFDFIPVRYALEEAGFKIGWTAETATIVVEEVQNEN